MNIREILIKGLNDFLRSKGIEESNFTVERPGDFKNGDYATNIALVYSKALKIKPVDFANEVKSFLKGTKGISKIEVAGPGFINFFIDSELIKDSIISLSKDIKSTVNVYSGKKVLVEYTDPNPFKIFHIGHLMSNSIGESLSRIIERSGAKVDRANYQGDVGLHVAKAIWGILKIENERPVNSSPISEQVTFISKAYVLGSDKYENDEASKKEIDQLNKVIFEKSDSKINEIYDWGRKVTLEHFEEIYKKLGTKFDHYFFESEVAGLGEKVVRDNIKEGLFEKSEGAIVFKGENHGLHTRVFINQVGLPTYDAKEIGLTKTKFDKINPDLSIVITANEQNDYFKVVLKAISLIYPDIALKTKHISHGMLRFASGKMSSRKGNVITGESLIQTMEEMVRERMIDRDIPAEQKEKIISDIAVGAIKYSILRQTAGSDIIYDFDKSISFEGDSGPYLQYSAVRANSILRKAEEEGIKPIADIKEISENVELSNFEKLLFRLDEVVERAVKNMEPHHITNYLIEIASAFNSYYAHNQIVNKEDKNSAYKVMTVKAFKNVMEEGLRLLGIRVPAKM